MTRWNVLFAPLMAAFLTVSSVGYVQQNTRNIRALFEQHAQAPTEKSPEGMLVSFSAAQGDDEDAAQEQDERRYPYRPRMPRPSKPPVKQVFVLDQDHHHDKVSKHENNKNQPVPA